MEINILENAKRKMVVEFIEAEQGLLNVLKVELWDNENVEAAGYQVEHPLIDKAKFTVETNTKETPQEAFSSALKKLKSSSEKLAKAFASAK